MKMEFLQLPQLINLVKQKYLATYTENKMLGFAKSFVIFIAAAIGYGTHSWSNFFVVIGAFAAVRFVWKLLT